MIGCHGAPAVAKAVLKIWSPMLKFFAIIVYRTKYLQVKWFDVFKGNVRVYSNEIAFKLSFTLLFQAPSVCHLTYLGHIPRVSPRFKRYTGTTYLRVFWYEVLKRNLYVCCNKIDFNLLFLTRLLGFELHLCVSHLTYLGCILPVSPRSRWNAGTTYLQVQWFDMLKGNLCVHYDTFDFKLSFARPFQALSACESLDKFRSYTSGFYRLTWEFYELMFKRVHGNGFMKSPWKPWRK